MTNPISASLLDRTLKHLSRVWHNLSDSRQTPDSLTLSGELSDTDKTGLLRWMDSCLEAHGGEVAARNRAAVLGESYLALSPQGRLEFLTLLTEHYDVAPEQVEQAFDQWRNATAQARGSARIALRDALDPPRMKLLTQFTSLPEGVKFLVDMRAELLTLKREHPPLASLEADLKRLLVNWFDIGLLQLEQISWQSSAQVLEKLIAYEAVHAIQSWDDLKNRLDSDRRCFAFFHPNMPDEPLIFVEVALVQGLADNVQKLLDEDAPLQDIRQADTAIFYSISNAQKGLAGISFGNFLIKRVVAQLQNEFPNLVQFSTLSPIPGFCRWLNTLSDQQLSELPGGKEWAQLPEPRLAPDWHLDEQQAQARRAPLKRLAAHYLCREKGRQHSALDPVAHFHLSNGAQVEQLNWLADCSNSGLRQSAGLMVNYLYDLPHIEARSQSYSEQGTVALSAQTRSFLK